MLTWFSRCVCLMLGLCDCGLHSGGQTFDCGAVCRVQRGIDRGEQSQQIYHQMGGKVFTLSFYMLSLTFIHLLCISFANLFHAPFCLHLVEIDCPHVPLTYLLPTYQQQTLLHAKVSFLYCSYFSTFSIIKTFQA